jgi:hypothetical protein
VYRLLRIIAILVALGCAAALLAEILFATDLFGFELEPLFGLLGWRGLAFILVLNLGLLVLGLRCFCWLRRRDLPLRRTSNVLLAGAAICMLWLLEWVFMESPLTVRLVTPTAVADAIELPDAVARDFAGFSLARNIDDPARLERMRVMYERARINSPDVFDSHPIGATIDRYATRYDVDPDLLFFFLYVGSFWGEAVSGPVPYFKSMSAETLRDLVQIHLPSWFIESDTRRTLVSGKTLETLFGQGLGFKLRYALHKATLDVSTQPYDLNLYSDILLVLREYPDEFPELNDSSATGIKAALRDAVRAIGASALAKPYEEPYSQAALGADYYEAHRGELKSFGRAAFYLAARDFDFATRVAALIVKYQSDHYARRIGEERWDAIPAWQRSAMLAMTRDLYVPNVGRYGHNLYALCELNCTPVEFVADRASNDPAGPGPGLSTLWRPKDYTLLWGGAATKLRIFNEMWETIHGTPIPGLPPEHTIEQARGIIALAAPR